MDNVEFKTVEFKIGDKLEILCNDIVLKTKCTGISTRETDREKFFYWTFDTDKESHISVSISKIENKEISD